MSFYTSLHFVRSTPPPRVTGTSLAEFIRKFNGLDVADDNGSLLAKIKFGERIDQDKKPTIWREPINAVIATLKEIEWDIEKEFHSIPEMADALARHHGNVYRAFISLGGAKAEVCRPLQRLNSPENKVDLTLDTWSFEIGPVKSSSLNSIPLFAGWMAVKLSGSGYLFPWTFADLHERAEAHPDIRRVMDLCRSKWPVAPEQPDRGLQKLRRKMAKFWPFAQIDIPRNWYWGLSETG